MKAASPVEPVTGPSARAHADEVEAGDRFAFGKNWSRFLARLTPERVAEAERSLREMLGRERLDGVRFLDIGSGSGLFSLAAWRLGASVTSIDYDPDSVACTMRLRADLAEGEGRWHVAQGSVLDPATMTPLRHFDVVYSWGVLHHTGHMWDAIDAAAQCAAPGGCFFIAIYNYQPIWTRYYTAVKQAYAASPRAVQRLFVAAYATEQAARGLVKDLFTLRNPLARYQAKIRSRGMSMWHDWVDWIGGYPFEAATPEAIVAFVRARGYALERVVTCGGGQGCNEFVFRRG
jgi:2-polyprenyl-6-hydroxyphenyl methylase/3-demethylubiquinone-9 3-methyltransferase